MTGGAGEQVAMDLPEGQALNDGHCPSCRWQPTKWEMRCGKLCRHPQADQRGFWDRHPDSYKHCWAYEEADFSGTAGEEAE